MAATFALATASYYLIERPVMEGVFWRRLIAAGPALVAMAVTVAVVVAGTTVTATAAAPAAARPNRVVAARATLPRTVHDQLVSAGAFSGHPVRFLVLGDSLAITLSVGLALGRVTGYGAQATDQRVTAWDDHLVAEYSQITQALSQQGVKVVLFTLPYFAPPEEAPDGSIYPENQS